jgi:hypothetical protein
MEASSAGKREYGGKEGESNTGRIWAAGFHRITARFRLAHVLKQFISLIFQFFFGPR